MTTNQIFVICLIVVLVGFVAVLANMGVNAVALIKEIKKLVGKSSELVDKSKETVQNVGESITTTASELVADSSNVTKVVAVAASGIVSANFVRGMFKHLLGKKSKKAKKQLKKSEKDLKAAKKAAKKARKIQRKAGKAAKIKL